MNRFLTYLLAFVAMTTVVSCSDKDEPVNEPVKEPAKEPANDTTPQIQTPTITITWESNPNFEKVDITDDLVAQIRVDADVYNAIATLRIVVESEVINNDPWNITEIDLFDWMDNPDYPNIFFGYLVGYDNSYLLDFSNILKKIYDSTTKDSDHTFTIIVGDENGRTTKKTAVFHRIAEEDSKIFTEEKISGVRFDMVYVKGGTFTMGASESDLQASSDEKPAHRVTLSDYYIGRYEVTQKQWTAVMGSNPSIFKGDNLPVENVSWSDVQKFISKLNEITGRTYRLPTEAEWEYAARGGNRSKGYKYSGSDNIDEVAILSYFAPKPVHVGWMIANELGLFDMSGNVMEWCSDWYDDYSSDSQINPTGPATGSVRVLRGGHYMLTAKYCRVSARFYDFQNNGAVERFCGFRLVLVP